jgi:hypothetical protein
VKIPREHQEGLVDKVDPNTGVMKVMYDVDEDGDGVADGSEEREVEYSNPDLVWLKEREEKELNGVEDEENEKSEIFSFSGSQSENSVADHSVANELVADIDIENDEDDDDDEDFPYTVIEKPSIKNAAGNWIKVGENGEEGLVDKVDTTTGVMTILYDSGALDPNDIPQSEESYDNPNIIWIHYDD